MKRQIITVCLSAAGLFGADRTPLVLDGKIPTYPQIAVAARISGSVAINLSVVNGVVTNAQVVHADNKLLIESTLQNVRTWRFEPSTNAQIATEFVYEIGKTESGVPQNPALELRLPGYVHIVANPVKPTTNH